MSEPIYLEEDKPYLFKMYSNQYNGPSEIGLGVKVHSSSLSGGIYDAENERQSITITSSIVREEHVSIHHMTCGCMYD